MRRVTGKTPDDVIRGIYVREGWQRREGESRVIRCKLAGWKFAVDHKCNRYFATLETE